LKEKRKKRNALLIELFFFNAWAKIKKTLILFGFHFPLLVNDSHSKNPTIACLQANEINARRNIRK
jgi:hypothetical protein